MAFVRTKYLCDRWGNVTRKSPSNKYTDWTNNLDYWRAGFTHGWIPDLKIDFFFETSGQAGMYSLWELYDPSQLMDAVGISNPFQVMDIAKIPLWKFANPYLPYKIKTFTWKVSLEDGHGKRIDLTYPTEEMANHFSRGGVFTGRSLFGTLPSIPGDVADQLQEYAERRRAADEDAERLKEEADRAREEAQRAKLQKDEAARNLAEEQLSAIYRQQQALKDNPPVPPPPSPPVTPSTVFNPGQGTNPADEMVANESNIVWTQGTPFQVGSVVKVGLIPGAQLPPKWYTITAGGAAGAYSTGGRFQETNDSISVEFRIYAEGTFTFASNGQWLGIFAKTGILTK